MMSFSFLQFFQIGRASLWSRCAAGCLSALAATAALHASGVVNAHPVAVFQSRELVDLEYQDDGSLSILLSSPGTPTPGLFRWSLSEAAPVRLCSIPNVSAFSFDRKYVIERDRSMRSVVRLYDAKDCRVVAEVPVDGYWFDVDASGEYVGVAGRTAERGAQLRLFRLSGEFVASTPIGRNVEMGFSPDGTHLINFDVSDGGLRAWELPTLATYYMPSWSKEGDISFVAGSPFVKHHQGGNLKVAYWPAGDAAYSLPAERYLRLRQFSADGRFGLAHRHQRGRDALEWIDFASGERRVLVSGSGGSIDHAALSRDLREVAWSQRGSGSHRVVVHRKPAP